MEVKRLEVKNANMTRIVCPVPNFKDIRGEDAYRMKYDGQDYFFEPMQVYEVEAAFGQEICIRAADHWRMQVENSKYERKMWNDCRSSSLPSVRDKARKFADENGNTVSKPLPRPGLVRLDTAEGKRYYEQGLEEQKAKTQTQEQKKR